MVTVYCSDRPEG